MSFDTLVIASKSVTPRVCIQRQIWSARIFGEFAGNSLLEASAAES